MSGDVRGFFQALDIELPHRPGQREAPLRCFAAPERHANEDKSASASVNTQNGAWYCHGCGAKGGAYHAALACGHDPGSAMRLMAAYGLTRTQLPEAGTHARLDQSPTASRQIRTADNGQRRTPPALRNTDADVRTWSAALAQRPDLLARIERELGWHRPVVEDLEIGLDWSGRLSIPVRGPTGALRGVLRYKPWRAEGEEKMLKVLGSKDGLIPNPSLEPATHVLLLEGPADTVAARSEGLPAIGLLSATAWRAEYARFFRGRHVTVIMDCDRAGRVAASRIVADLRRECEFGVLDLDPQCLDGYDLSNWLRDPAHVGLPVAGITRGRPRITRRHETRISAGRGAPLRASSRLDELRRLLPTRHIAAINARALELGVTVVRQPERDLMREQARLRAALAQAPSLSDGAKWWKAAHGATAVKELAMLETERRLAAGARDRALAERAEARASRRAERLGGPDRMGASPLDEWTEMLGEPYSQELERAAAREYDAWESHGWLRDRRRMAALEQEIANVDPFRELDALVERWLTRTVDPCGAPTREIVAELEAIDRDLDRRARVSRWRDQPSADVRGDGPTGRDAAEAGEWGDAGPMAARAAAVGIDNRLAVSARVLGDLEPVLRELASAYRDELMDERPAVLQALRRATPNRWEELDQRARVAGYAEHRLERDLRVAATELRGATGQAARDAAAIRVREVTAEGDRLHEQQPAFYRWIEHAHEAAELAAIEQAQLDLDRLKEAARAPTRAPNLQRMGTRELAPALEPSGLTP